MKTYYYSVQLGEIKTFGAQNDEDFTQNICRVESLPVLFFSQDRSLVQQFLNEQFRKSEKDKAVAMGIPKDIVDLAYKSGRFDSFCQFWKNSLNKESRVEFVSDSYENGQLKPYFLIYWDDNEVLNFKFVQRKEVIDSIIIAQEKGDYVSVISSARGEYIFYTVEYSVNLEE